MTPPKRVLLVDDSSLVRHALSRRITVLGFEVLQAESEEHALNVDVASLAIVVMDLELGSVDGTGIAAKLLAANPQLRVAFFTSGSTARVLERAQAIGPVFAKPDDLEHLVAWLTQT
jgi:DNA-binding NarL/FixJ family response regulator